MCAVKHLPRYAAAFHVVGQCHIIRPHIKLPLDQTKYTAMHTSGVDADTHIYIDSHHFTNKPTVSS